MTRAKQIILNCGRFIAYIFTGFVLTGVGILLFPMFVKNLEGFILTHNGFAVWMAGTLPLIVLIVAIGWSAWFYCRAASILIWEKKVERHTD